MPSQNSKTKVVKYPQEECDVYIGRPTPWGNPWSSKPTNLAEVVCSKQEAVDNYRKWLNGEDFVTFEQEKRNWILDNIKSLEGKRLGCWCESKPCHGDVLVDLIEKNNKPDKKIVLKAIDKLF